MLSVGYSGANLATPASTAAGSVAGTIRLGD